MNGEDKMQQERIDKIISSQGLYSRKDVKTIIRKGLVTVNGKCVKNSDIKVDVEKDIITVSGEKLIYKKYIYVMMNKPGGVISASRDKNAKTVLDLLPENLFREGLFPAGRLDKDTEGFVFITNDGDLAHRILSPRNHVPKTYIAVIDKPVDDSIIEAFRNGVVLSEETVCKSAELRVLENSEYHKVEVIISEGMYHQIKRMFLHFGIKVMCLKRTRIGYLDLDPDLGAGESREIVDKEIEKLLCK